MNRLLTVLSLALVCFLPVGLSAEEALEGTHEGVDLIKVTHYDNAGASNKIEFFADNSNSYDVILIVDIKDSTGLRTIHDEEGTFVASGEKRRVVTFVLEEVGGTGNYEFDWFVVPDYEYFDMKK